MRRFSLSGIALAMLVAIPVAGAQQTWYVDDDAPGDPGPGDTAVGDPLEDGTAEHPFDHPQEGIDAAADGDTVLVKPGEYVITEPIDFNRLHDPEDPASPPVKNIVVRSEGGAEVTTIRMAETPADVERGRRAFVRDETMANALARITCDRR